MKNANIFKVLIWFLKISNIKDNSTISLQKAALGSGFNKLSGNPGYL
jgi:hypothetical protein